MKKYILILSSFILLIGTNIKSEAQNNSNNPYDGLNKFLEAKPCIVDFLGKDGVKIENDSKGYTVIKVTKTGIPDYDQVGGLGFYNFGVVYKINQPKATGIYNCGESEYPNTIIENIKIIWQTDATGQATATSSGKFQGKNCNNKPLPHEIGCSSIEIGEVQGCLPGIPVSKVLDEETVYELKNRGYDMSNGLTKEIYNDVMVKCGKRPLRRNSGNN